MLLSHPDVGLIYYLNDVWLRKAQKEAKADTPPGPHAHGEQSPFLRALERASFGPRLECQLKHSSDIKLCLQSFGSVHRPSHDIRNNAPAKKWHICLRELKRGILATVVPVGNGKNATVTPILLMRDIPGKEALPLTCI